MKYLEVFGSGWLDQDDSSEGKYDRPKDQLLFLQIFTLSSIDLPHLLKQDQVLKEHIWS